MKPREITITPVLNGFHVRVGCQALAFHEKDKLISELDRYLDNPEAVTKEYLTKYGPLEPQPECAPPPVSRNIGECRQPQPCNATLGQIR